MPTTDALTFKEEARQLYREAQPVAFSTWMNKLASNEATIDDWRKFNEHIAKVVGLEEDRKVDQFAGVATFNFTIGVGGIQAEMVSAGPKPPLPFVEVLNDQHDSAAASIAAASIAAEGADGLAISARPEPQYPVEKISDVPPKAALFSHARTSDFEGEIDFDADLDALMS
jgi:hypothetical protein